MLLLLYLSAARRHHLLKGAQKDGPALEEMHVERRLDLGVQPPDHRSQTTLLHAGGDVDRIAMVPRVTMMRAVGRSSAHFRT